MNVYAPYEGHYKNETLATIVLPLNPALFSTLPEILDWNGMRFYRKEEFHVTLVHVQHASELSGRPREEIAALFNSFVEKNPIEFLSFSNNLRQAEEDENTTVLAQCTVSNIDGLFANLNRTFGIEMSVQPAHVTLYSLEKNKGIHVNSDEEMKSLERVHLPELEVALAKIQRPT